MGLTCIKILSNVAIIIFLSVSRGSSNELPNLKSFQKCIKESNFPVSAFITERSNQTHYTHLNYRWNLRVPPIYPIGFLLPKSTAQVQAAVKCGFKFNIRLIPKSGGHSYESFSFGSQESIILDLRHMTKIEIDAEAETSTIESGALIGQINEKLWNDPNSGGFGLPLGDCLTVGIGGFTLGGGYGYLAHAYGLAIDNLLEAEMVDAAGNLLIVNSTKNADLFWALRGVGSGLIGIVTKFKFRIFPASALKVQLLRLHYDLRYATDVLIGWQKWITWSQINAPHILGEVFFIGESTPFSQSDSSIQIDFIDVHNSFKVSGNTSVVDIIVNIFPPNGNFTQRTFDTYMDFLMEFADAKVKSGKKVHELNFTTIREDEEALQRYVKQKTFFVDKLSFSLRDLSKVGQLLAKIPQKYLWVNLQSDGGALDKAIGGETSYVHRKVSYGIIARYEGPDDATELKHGLAWLKTFVKMSKFMDNGEAYQNYVDRDLSDYLQRYYGKNLAKLIRIKRKWDPTNYFLNSQSLPIHLVK